MTQSTVTLPVLEAFMASKRKGLAFPPALEALYDEQMLSYRLKVMAKGILPAIVVYNLFLIADFLLLPHTFVEAVILHFCVVTPAILLIALLYPKISVHWLREIAAAAIPLLMVGQIMLIYTLNSTGSTDHMRIDAADHYQYLAVMIVIYTNVNQRFGFRRALVSTAMLATVYLSALLPSATGFDTKFIGVSLMLSGGYLSLIANRRMEQDMRYGFLRRLKDQLLREGAEEVSRRDPLTGLANRRQLDKVADRIWNQSGYSAESVSVIMIDIDHFKPFNDRYGHVAGDTCLKRVAAAIESELRGEEDLAARFGGEEFLLLLPSSDLSIAVRIAERLRRRVEELAIPNQGYATSGIVTASVGVASGPISAHGFTELVAAADAALYAAKRNGRNQVWPPFVVRSGTVTPIKPPPGESPGQESASATQRDRQRPA